MPCLNASHTHDWPRLGTLSILKCESKCGFCTSTKDYKPASALRKHVLTHIKNDGMPLTLEKSTGGRPRLQTASVAPTGLAQLLQPLPSPEISVAAEPVLGNADTEEGTINNNDNVLNSSNNVLATESHLTYSSRVASIIENRDSGKDAVHLLRSLGSKEDLVEEAFHILKIFWIEIEYVNLWEWLRGPDNSCWFWYHIDRGYSVFLQAFQGLVQTSSPATALEVFYATITLSVIDGFLYDPARIPRGFEACISEQPIFMILERPTEALSALLDFQGIGHHSVWLGETGRLLYSHWKFMMVLNVPSESDSSGTLVERLGDSIDRFLHGYRPTVPLGGDQKRRWNLEWEERYEEWHFSSSEDETGGPQSSRSQNSATRRSNPHYLDPDNYHHPYTRPTVPSYPHLAPS